MHEKSEFSTWRFISSSGLIVMTIAALGFTSTCLGQLCPKWQQVGVSARRYHAMAYDQHRNVFVLFGGEVSVSYSSLVLGDTLEFDIAANRWTRLSVDGPSPRYLHAMAYDSARKVVVLYGGVDDDYDFLNDTWEWDGSQWHLRANTGPMSRVGHAMCYDEARNVTVMFGYGADTWEWDGVSWTQRATTGPAFRWLNTMVYDRKRNVSVLFGGEDSAYNCLQDTWEWNGQHWTQRHAPGPLARARHCMAYDDARQRIVMQGGANPTVTFDDTWEYDGNAWQIKHNTQARQRYGAAMIYADAPQLSYVFGGVTRTNAPAEIQNPAMLDGETWSWNGTVWNRVAVSPTGFHFGNSMAMTFDETRGATVLIETYLSPASRWEWDGVEWSHEYAGDFSRLWDSRVVYDSQRDAIVLFGGIRSLYGHVAETWEYKEGQWTLRSSEGPLPRHRHAMAYDKHRGVVVLFGGKDKHFINLNDTWEWNGQVWTQKFPAQFPVAQSDHSMAYDEERQRTVLSGAQFTWEWDGQNWTPKTYDPNILWPESSIYDTYRKRVLRIKTDFRTYRWNGLTWMQLASAAFEYVGIPVVHLAAYDRKREVGMTFVGGAMQTWEVVNVHRPGDVTCDGAVGAADLLFVANQWGACSGSVYGCPADIAPAGPPMGDGVVNVLDLLMVIDNWSP